MNFKDPHWKNPGDINYGMTRTAEGLIVYLTNSPTSNEKGGNATGSSARKKNGAKGEF